MRKSAFRRFVAAVLAGVFGGVIGCSPAEKKIDTEESKRQLKALRQDLQKEHGEK